MNSNSSQPKHALSNEALHDIDAYWRAANYLSVAQIYLRDNPLLKQPLSLDHIKKVLLGHWGTTPGQNFIYAHLNRAITKYNLNMIYISGPGHGGPALTSNTYLEGTYSEIYPQVTQDEVGLKKLFQQFSFPGGISSHASPQIPGSIHEGGELGYSLSHAFGAVFDNPNLIAACVVGDGEAETGPLATAWHSNKFLSPTADGVVLPILHLNGYKISNPTVLARIDHDELEQLMRGYGWTPHFVEGDDPLLMHQQMAATIDHVIEQIQTIKATATDGDRPRWPMIILRTPKGWTGPQFVDGQAIEGTFRAHQVPLIVSETSPRDHIEMLQGWLKSYRPEELFDEKGRPIPRLAKLVPKGNRRMGSNPHANGGQLLRPLAMPDFRDYALEVSKPTAVQASSMRTLAPFLRDIIKFNEFEKNFRIFSPDETISNRLGSVFEITNRPWEAEIKRDDEFLGPNGRVMDGMLSEHQAEGWLEGYLLTGRHGLFHSYEAFIRIVDSMLTQHAKWLKMADELPWRHDIASLNYLLTSHVWRQDHNGFTHQDPGFIDHMVNKKGETIRVYLPPDANTLLSTIDHCLRSKNYINLVICGKHEEAPQFLDMEAAIKHCTDGIGIWEWASNDNSEEPDVVMACAGDVPTVETLAAVAIMQKHLPDLKIRVVNVVDLMRLQPPSESPHGLTDEQYDAIFTRDKHIIFAYHGYPWLIHRLSYRRANRNLHVRGYKEEGTITTAFDMTVLNNMDRYHLVMDTIDRLPQTGEAGRRLKAQLQRKLDEHRAYITTHGVDMPEVHNWKWGTNESGSL